MKTITNVKFFVLFLHLILTSIIFFTKYQNAMRFYIKDSTISLTEMTTYIDTFLVLSLVLLTIQILISLIGIPLNKQIIPYQLLLQILGLFSYACFILIKMNYRSISFMWGVFCFIPFVFDVGSVISKHYQNRKYSYLEDL